MNEQMIAWANSMNEFVDRRPADSCTGRNGQLVIAKGDTMSTGLIGQTLDGSNADALVGEQVMMVVSLPGLTIIDVTDDTSGLVAALVDFVDKRIVRFSDDPCNLPPCACPSQVWVLVGEFSAMEYGGSMEHNAITPSAD